MRRFFARGAIRLMMAAMIVFPALTASCRAATYEPYGVAVLQALDKISGKVKVLEIAVGDSMAFGSLNIIVHTCQKTVPEDEPESAAFLEIDDQPAGTAELQRVFNGWMFASSPALSALQHPRYDVWVIDCKMPLNGNAEPPAAPPPAPVAPAPDPRELGE